MTAPLLLSPTGSSAATSLRARCAISCSRNYLLSWIKMSRDIGINLVVSGPGKRYSYLKAEPQCIDGPADELVPLDAENPPGGFKEPLFGF